MLCICPCSVRVAVPWMKILKQDYNANGSTTYYILKVNPISYDKLSGLNLNKQSLLLIIACLISIIINKFHYKFLHIQLTSN